jgi:hypothetical protein
VARSLRMGSQRIQVGGDAAPTPGDAEPTREEPVVVGAGEGHI